MGWNLPCKVKHGDEAKINQRLQEIATQKGREPTTDEIKRVIEEVTGQKVD